ncbi:meprin A subunit alpha-like isoform X2 [Paramacrobiotus metropolitanus]|uniref:meprin A subunit alpha-like isoform X2 n=1 Tax=Paramacrobiotus metropolitanus TaxID=2943436 RepID=UPI0024460604|nr:meprin A subunit alpha-like isoform X2 [Paramacrobiotus metropolitanus]
MNIRRNQCRWLFAQIWIHFFMHSGIVYSQLPADWKSYISPEILEKYLGQDNDAMEYQTSLFEGDIKEIDRDSGKTNVSEGGNNFSNDKNIRWPDGIIPYLISSGFNTEERMNIRKALREISDATTDCVRFIEYTSRHKHYIRFAKSRMCASCIGRRTGMQMIELSSQCVKELGTIQHEVMHALGFFHEMSRRDRDEYVTINYENILTGAAFNFDSRNGRTFGLPYDYSSVLHYSIFDFAKDSSVPVIVPTRKPAQCIGQRINLSFLDAVKIKLAYGCMDESEIPRINWEESMRNHPMCGQMALQMNEALTVGKNYFSPSMTFRLVLQSDHNLVLYRECDGWPVFMTHTNGLPSVRAILPDDGHFQLEKWDVNGGLRVPYWTSETWGYGESQLVVSDSGYLYLSNYTVGAYWRSSGHHNHGCNGTSEYIPAKMYKHHVILRAGENLDLESSYASPNKLFSLEIDRQHGHHLIVWRRCDHRHGFKAMARQTIARVTLQDDGNLMMYDEYDNLLWYTGTYSPDYVEPELRLYDNGFLYLCDHYGCYWQSSGFLDTCS